MADFDFDALEKRMRDLEKPLSADELDSYINQLGSLSGAQAEKAKGYIERLKIMKDRAAVFDRDRDEFEKKLEAMTPEEFAARDKEIAENITPEKVAKAAGKIEGLSDEENDAVHDFMTSEAQLMALQEGDPKSGERGYDNIIEQAVQRTEAGMAQSVAASYYDKEITLLTEQLEKETDKAKQDEIKSKIAKMQEAQTHVAEFANLSDLKDKNIPVDKDIIAGYIAAKSAINSAKHAVIEKLFGKNTKIGAFARRADDKLSKTFGKFYTVPRDIIKKAGPKAIVNAAGGIVCSAAFGPAGPAIWAGVKTAYLGIESLAEQRKEKNKAREDLKALEEQIAQNSNNPEKLKELTRQKAECQKKISASYFSFLKSHPDKLIHLGISAFTAVGSYGLLKSGIDTIDFSDSLGNVRDAVANNGVVGRFGNLSERISNMGLKVSGRAVLGASTSVMNGVSTAGLELGRAFSDKEHRREHLRKALRSFGIGFAGAAAAMGLNSLMMDRAAAKAGIQNDPSQDPDVDVSEAQTQGADLENVVQPEIYKMDASTHDTIKDLMIRGPRHAAKYLHDQGLLNEKDAAFFQKNGYMTSSRLKEILDSGVLKEEHASGLLAEHGRVLTPTGYRLAEDQARWDEYIAAKNAVKETVADSNVLQNNPNISLSENSPLQEVEAEVIPYPKDMGPYDTPDGMPPVYDESQDNLVQDGGKIVEAEEIPHPKDMGPYDTPDGKPPVYEEPVVQVDRHQMPDGGMYAIQEKDGVIRTAIGVNVENEDIAAFNRQTGLSLQPNMGTRNIVAQEKIYEDLLRRQSNGETLSGAEQQFMSNFDRELKNNYGLTRGENGKFDCCGDVENAVRESTVSNASRHEMEDGAYMIKEENGVPRVYHNADVDHKDVAAFNQKTGLSLQGSEAENMVVGEKIYEDLLKRQSNGETLSSAEQQFMAKFDRKLENDYGLTRDENGEIVCCSDVENTSAQIEAKDLGGYSDISDRPYIINEHGSVVATKSLTSEDMAQVNRFIPEVTKNSKGMYVCGNSVAATGNIAAGQEKAILSGIYANDKAYQYMQAKQASGETLSEAEKTFMRGHESILKQRGLTHDDSGALTVADEKAGNFDSFGIVNSKSEIDQMRMDSGSSCNPSHKYGIYNGESLEKKVNMDSYKIAKKYNLTEEERQQWAGAVVKAKEDGCEVIVSQGRDGKNMIFMRDKKNHNIYTNFSDKNESAVERQAIEIGKRMTKNYGQRE